MSRSKGDTKIFYCCGFCSRRLGGHGNLSSHQGAHIRAGDQPQRKFCASDDQYERLVADLKGRAAQERGERE